MGIQIGNGNIDQQSIDRQVTDIFHYRQQLFLILPFAVTELFGMFQDHDNVYYYNWFLQPVAVNFHHLNSQFVVSSVDADSVAVNLKFGVLEMNFDGACLFYLVPVKRANCVVNDTHYYFRQQQKLR